MYENWQEIGKYRENGRNYIVFMSACLSQLKGNVCPHFSIIGCARRATSIWNIDKRYKYPANYGVCHNLLLHVKPSLSDLVAMHLCDMDGTPMYALENGFFYCQHAETYSDDAIAHHFRISLADVPALRGMSEAELSAWIETQRPRWKAEADAVISKYNLQIVSE